jgi:hypothetical protein
MPFYKKWQFWTLFGAAMLDTVIPFLPLVAWGLLIAAMVGRQWMFPITELLDGATSGAEEV